MILGFDRRQFLLLAMLLAMTPAAHASDDGGNSGSGSSGSGSDGSGSNSGSGGGDDGDSGNSGSGGDDGNSGNSGSGSDDNDDSDDNAGKSGTDQDDALEAVRDGEIISLNKAIGIVRSRNPGKVIDVSLKRRSLSDIYSFKIKSSSGRITTVRMDARTGRIVGF